MSSRTRRWVKRLARFPARLVAVVLLAALVLGGCAARRETGRKPGPAKALPPAAAARQGSAATTAPAAASAAAPPPAVAAVRPPAASVPRVSPAARPDDGPLTAKIGPETPGGRAAALRLTEQGRGLLARGEQERAIELLERAVAVDARTPYAYHFLAEAHYQAGRLELARAFLDRAEQKLGAEPYWLGEVRTLRGRLCERQGRREEARRAYQRALEAAPANEGAAAGLARLGGGDGAKAGGAP